MLVVGLQVRIETPIRPWSSSTTTWDQPNTVGVDVGTLAHPHTVRLMRSWNLIDVDVAETAVQSHTMKLMAGLSSTMSYTAIPVGTD